MQPFVWAPWFDTGLATVDQQHRRFVELLNNLALVGDRSSPTPEPEGMLRELAEYAAYHFREEEREMARCGIDPRHVGAHVAEHRSYLRQVTSMGREAGKDLQRQVSRVAMFATSWLTRHILEVDQEMARQVRSISAGRSPEEAFDSDRTPRDPASGALLGAIGVLHDLLAERNSELAAANRLLEERVAARTAELESSTRELQASLKQLKETQEGLAQSKKMAAVGLLAGGVAHEVNNPLAVIASSLLYFDEELPALKAACRACRASFPSSMPSGPGIELGLDDLAQVVQESRQEANRVRDIVRNLQEFAHPEGRAWRVCDLEKELDATVRFAARQLGLKTGIRCQYHGLPTVECLPASLRQVFLGVLANAMEAASENGQVWVRTGRLDENHIWVEVDDNGCGIPLELQERIFEPFYTTKRPGQGIGLGLSTAFATVQQHHGRIEVDSAPNRGTRMRVVLPIRQPSTSGDLPG